MTFVSTAKPPLSHLLKMLSGFCSENSVSWSFKKAKTPAFRKLVILKKPTSLPTEQHFFGMLNGQPCYVSGLEERRRSIPESFSVMELRQVFRRFETDGVQAAGLAGHLLQWHRNHQYCSRCGKPNEDKEDERAKICPGCGLINYPQAFPGHHRCCGQGW